MASSIIISIQNSIKKINSTLQIYLRQISTIKNQMVNSNNLKTINHQSLIGSGNINIVGTGTGEENKIDIIKVNNTSLPIQNKTVNIIMPQALDDAPSDGSQYVRSDNMWKKLTIDTENINNDTVISISECIERYTLLKNALSKSDLTLCQCIRYNTYKGTSWDTIADTPNSTDITTYNNSKYNFNNIKFILLPNGELLDCPHFFVVLNVGLFNKKYIDLASWAGDLITYAKELENETVTKFPQGTFPLEDYVSDLDAYNISNMDGDTLEGKLASYYNGNLYLKRETIFLGNTNLSTKYQNSAASLMLGMLIINQEFSNSTDAINNAIEKIQQYMDMQITGISISNTNDNSDKITELETEIQSINTKINNTFVYNNGVLRIS